MQTDTFFLFPDLALPKNSAALAPLAGYSDLAMRLLCKHYGATLFFTEMVSIKGVFYNGNNTKAILTTNPQDLPLIVQLFGSEPEIFKEAADLVQSMGFKYFDVNMGCSVPKVIKTGAGAAMLKNLDNSIKCAEAILKQTKGNTGFKMRLGYDMHQQVFLDFAKALENAGAAYLTLHPRYAKQGFTGLAPWEHIKTLKATVKIPVIASGDLMTAKDGIACLKETGADMLMYARGALRDPLIFENHNLLLAGKESLPHSLERTCAMIRFYADLCKANFPDKALLRMRTFVPRCLHFFHNVSHLRKALIQVRTWEEFDLLLEEFYRNNHE